MKTHRGITEMKINVFIVLLMVAMFYLALTVESPSRQYWESVGPKWDKMFNPNKYAAQE